MGEDVDGDGILNRALDLLSCHYQDFCALSLREGIAPPGHPYDEIEGTLDILRS
jgi:hypothetical protein